jgi:folate-binding protein YgfZ
LQPGQGRETAFVTSTARIIDLVSAFATEDAIWLITSPERFAILAGWLPRFVFFTDDVQFSDEGDHFALLSLLGPKSGELLTKVGAGAMVGQESIKGAHRLMEVAAIQGVRVAVGGGLVGKGYTLIVPADGAATVWNALRQAGAEAMGEAVWESLRIEQGRPAADREITESHNPLEAGLWEAISFNKGCYIGQEIIARLDTYQKLKQQLWGLRLSAPVQPNTPLQVEGKQVGTVTSVTTTPEGPFALGYIRTKAGGAGLRVQVGENSAEVVDLPYISRARSDI